MGLEWRCCFTHFLWLKSTRYFSLDLCSTIFLPYFLHGFVNDLRRSHLQLVFLLPSGTSAVFTLATTNAGCFPVCPFCKSLNAEEKLEKLTKFLYQSCLLPFFFFFNLILIFELSVFLCLLKSVISFDNNFASSLLQSSSIPYHSGISYSSSRSCSCCCHCHSHSTSTPAWSISPNAGFAV